MFRLKRLVKLLIIILISILPVQSNSFVDVDSIIGPPNLDSANLTSNNLFCEQLKQLDCLDKFKQRQHDGAKIETNVIKQRRRRGRDGKAEDEDATTTIKDDKILSNGPTTSRALTFGKQVANSDQSEQRNALSTSGDKLERRIGPILLPLALVLALLRVILQLLRAILQLLRILLLPLEILLPPLFVLLQVVRLLLRLLDPLFYLQLILLALNIASNIARAILRIIFISRRRRRRKVKEEERETRVITLQEEEEKSHHHHYQFICLPSKRRKKKTGRKSKQNGHLDRREFYKDDAKLFSHQTIYKQLLLSELEQFARYHSKSDIPPSNLPSQLGAAQLHSWSSLFHAPVLSRSLLDT